MFIHIDIITITEKCQNKTELSNIYYLVALICKALYLYNCNPHSHMEVYYPKVHSKFCLTFDRKYNFISNLGLRDIFGNNDSCILEIMKLLDIDLDFKKIDFLCTLSYKILKLCGNFNNGAIAIQWDLQKLINHMKDALSYEYTRILNEQSNEQPNEQPNEQSNEQSNELVNIQFNKNILSNLKSNENLHSKCESNKFVDGHFETIGEYLKRILNNEPTSHILRAFIQNICVQIYKEMKFPYAAIYPVFIFRKFIFDNIPCANVYRVPLEKAYTIDEIKSHEYETVQFNTNTNIYELIKDYAKYETYIGNKPKHLRTLKSRFNTFKKNAIDLCEYNRNFNRSKSNENNQIFSKNNKIKYDKYLF